MRQILFDLGIEMIYLGVGISVISLFFPRDTK